MFKRPIFKNFAPALNLEISISTLLSDLLDVAPYGSEMSSCIERAGRRYFCNVGIASQAGQFETRVQGSSARLAAQKAQKMLWKQLMKWHERRELAAAV